MHIPVLLKEVIEYLDPKPGKKFIDATVGEGGHAREIIRKGGIILSIDQDPEAIKRFRNNAPQPPVSAQVRIVQGNFADLKRIAEENGFIGVSGILFDLGLGSHQLDDAARGFSFQKDGPLNMRFECTISGFTRTSLNPSSRGGRYPLTAAQILNNYPEKELVRIFYEYGEEKRFGKRIARAILESRKLKSLETTAELFELIKKALPANFRYRAGDTARRIFQALRIAVNDELKNLERALPQALELLLEHGRLVVISFHSLEDRMVKEFFVKNAKDCVCPPSFPVCRCQAKASLRILTKKPITASPQEIQTNPRARSAKLRVAEKI